MPVRRTIDLTPLNHLLQLAGQPEDAVLIAALISDLETTKGGLDAAWKGQDFASLRANAHDLVALAGTVGDIELQSIAQRLNETAHAQNMGELERLKPATMSGIEELIFALGARLQSVAGGISDV